LRSTVFCRSKLLLAIFLEPKELQAGACSYKGKKIHTIFIMKGGDVMEELMKEAMEIIEMSLSGQSGKEEYTSRARDWLKRAALQAGDGEGSYCARCGNDLVCPSCR